MKAPRKHQAIAIAKLVALHLDGPDEWLPEHFDTAEVAARDIAQWLRVAGIPGPLPEKVSNPVDLSEPKSDGDSPELKASKTLVRTRARGLCEIVHVGCTGRIDHVHHRRRRSQGGSDAPDNLLGLCNTGHSFVHDHPKLSFEKGWLLHALPVTTA